ncbi:PREDICTED: minor histocompatibility antigen H13 isoform X2 [Galeopterus variegatus]|uniref:Minor histocompatibility antigen H13 isoform X2 n=1 Tax=Galeopterus variegatus TaxID=482537 RepID=A0ABM0RYH5_GALVR|nr:PREDICTED: minor histocompatibility antigen H13 isoform X2 [Galeopterus variegatus]
MDSALSDPHNGSAEAGSPTNGTTRPPSTPEGIALAYGSLLLMALLPIFFGALRSVRCARGKNASDMPETITSRDAARFPIIASCTLLGLYLFFKVFSQEYINLLLSMYFFVLGILALSHTISGVSPGLAGERPRSRQLCHAGTWRHRHSRDLHCPAAAFRYQLEEEHPHLLLHQLCSLHLWPGPYHLHHAHLQACPACPPVPGPRLHWLSCPGGTGQGRSDRDVQLRVLGGNPASYPKAHPLPHSLGLPCQPGRLHAAEASWPSPPAPAESQRHVMPSGCPPARSLPLSRGPSYEESNPKDPAAVTESKEASASEGLEKKEK